MKFFKRLHITPKSFNHNQLSAFNLLKEIKLDLRKTNFPLKNTMLSTVKLVEDALKGKRPPDADVLTNAALIDDHKGSPLIKAFLKMNVSIQKLILSLYVLEIKQQPRYLKTKFPLVVDQNHNNILTIKDF